MHLSCKCELPHLFVFLHRLRYQAVLSFQRPNPKISLVFFCVYSATLILFVSRDDLEEYLEPQEQAQHGDLHGGLQAFPLLGAYFPVLHAARRRFKKAAPYRCYFPSFSAMSVTLMRCRINILQILRMLCLSVLSSYKV